MRNLKALFLYIFVASAALATAVVAQQPFVPIGPSAAGDIAPATVTTGTVTVSNLVVAAAAATSASAPTITAAATIAPSTPIAFVTGTTAITTITAPAPISARGGQITIIPGAVFVVGNSGNVALTTTAVVSKALIYTYDSGKAKWYPSN